jgi:putative protease
MSNLELLAPAGNLAAGIVAFDSGADAVYCGLKRFSARDRAENFSFDDLLRLLIYAHEREKKVYLAFNTLVKESEIPDAARMIAKIAEFSVDALIVQDIGIVRLIREYFPFLPIHASTQMAIHNSASAKIAKEMGISRVILERQLSFSEIREISEKSPVETEIFIHGALCCSLSGQCLLSSWLGAYSGNRGKCKQACRFPSANGDTYPLSTRDLCMADSIFALKKMKIAALKIEGRLRPTDYISNVVSAYRLLLDAPEKDFELALKEAKRRIALSCGRHWLGGFKHDFKELINFSESGASGIRCGEVRRLDKNGFFADISGKLHLGDKIRVQKNSGASASSFTVKRIILDGEDVKSVRNAFVFLPCERPVDSGDAIYKIGESSSPDPAKFEKLPLFSRMKLDFNISISADNILIDMLVGNNLRWEKKHHFAIAKSRPLDVESLKKLFSESASEFFAAGRIDIAIDGDYFIPLSEMKQIRREFWLWVSENVKIENPQKKVSEEGLKKFFHDYTSERIIGDKIQETTYLLRPEQGKAEKDALLCIGIDDFAKVLHADEIILPSFCPEDKINELRAKIANATRGTIRRFRVTSLAHFAFLQDMKDIFIIVSFPLQCANSLALCEFRRLGARKVQAWPELEKFEMENLLEKSDIPMEIFCEGSLPLFYTRGNIAGEFCEIRGEKFPVLRNSAGLNILLSPQKLNLPPINNSSIFRDFSNCSENEKGTSFNFYSELK